MQHPSWLPALFEVSPWHHDTYDLLYDLFHENFIANKTYHRGKYVGFSRDLEDGKERIFWHLTTRDDKTLEDRFPDLRRSERLPWLKPMLEKNHNPEVLVWEYTESDGSTNIYIWLKDHDYVAIIKKIKTGALILITAYWIEYENVKKKLKKKYDSRNKKADA